MKQKDYTAEPQNVFFGLDKNCFSQKLNIFNLIVINRFTIFFLYCLLWQLAPAA
jgi:hypothetical protein